jgi:SAM-dependent methyltransferase
VELTATKISLESFRKEFQKAKVKARCLCGNDRVIPLMRKDRYGISIMPSFCVNCGHVYAKFKLGDEHLPKFYAGTYRNLYTDAARLKNNAKTASKIKYSREVIIPVFEDLFPRENGKVVIEWGCSAGWNLVPFKEKGIHTYGLDFDTEYVEYGRAEFGLELFAVPNFSDPRELVNTTADFLILNHVLEHAAQPIELLIKVTDLLKRDGYVFVGLPFLENIPAWGFKNFFHVAHLHYFSLPYFMTLAEAHGFRTIRHDKNQGYVVIQLAGNTRHPVRYRIYNARVLLKHGFWYLLTTFPYQCARRVTKKILRAIKQINA